MRTADAATIGSLIERGAARLGDAGIGGARTEALALWRGLFESEMGRPELRSAEGVSQEEVTRWEAALAERAAGVPMPYILEKAGFRYLDLFVDRRVLIPRPETEGLVQLVLDWARAESRWGRVADVGTGSGCIALSLATEGRFEGVVATDISRAALEVARRNLEAVAPGTGVDLRHGDLCAPLEDDAYDVLASNPPYVAPPEWEGLDASVADHEPRVALESPDGGMAHLDRILRDGRRCLRPGGIVVLEIDSRRGPRTRRAAVAAGWRDVSVRRDVFGRDRFLMARSDG